MFIPEDNTVILKDKSGNYILFEHPVEICVTDISERIENELMKIDSYVHKGYYAAGYLAYEAGISDDNFQQEKHSANFMPLLWFGIYKNKRELGNIVNNSEYAELLDWKPEIDPEKYQEIISQIKCYLQRGETYQINYTFRLESCFNSSPWNFFTEYCVSENIPYSAYIQTKQFAVASASPELFFELDKERIISSPMKGTRSFNSEKERLKELIQELSLSEKDKAENLMIVDMIRNDLGKIAVGGTVKVNDLFKIKVYNSVIQMTSDVEALLRDFSFLDVIRAIFPCASITGAPKYNSMKIINKLESKPRSIYTGTIGYIDPAQHALFNVAIRTSVFDMKSNRVIYGVGSGIVWDSDAAEEYEECLEKTKCIRVPSADFELFESILYDAAEKSLFLSEYHIERLKKSAAICSFTFPEKAIRAEMDKFFAEENLKLKILLNREGDFRIFFSSLENITDKKLEVKVSSLRTDSNNFYLYHKTTKRFFYNNVKSQFPHLFDIIFLNERGEVTESTIANVVIEKSGRKYTPLLSSGILPGTFRRYLLENEIIEEKLLYAEDLYNADKLFLINSVRKWLEVTIY